MKVLVTGATGFVGGNVARAFQARGYEVAALVRPGSSTLTIHDADIEVVCGDIRDRESVSKALEGRHAVVHCAALYTFWARDSRLLYEVNVEGTRIVLEEAMKAGVDRCVYTSTVSTVGIPAKGNGTEHTEASEKELVGHYKRSKYLAERVALDLSGQGLPVVVVNPTTPVGPWDVKPSPTGRMVLDFVRGRIPAYVDTGMNVVDVEDVAMGHVLALERGKAGERYLLGHQNVTLQSLFRMLEEISGEKAPKIRLPFWIPMVAGYLDDFVEGTLLKRRPYIPLEGLKVARKPMYVSCEKAVKELGLPQNPIKGGLEKAVRWFRDFGYVDGARAAGTS